VFEPNNPYRNPRRRFSQVALCILLACTLGCFSKTNSKKPIPRGFQNIKLGLTLGDVKHLAPNGRVVSPEHYQIETPSDNIEKIDCFFAKGGSHLYEMVLTGYIREDLTFDEYVRKKSKRYGIPTKREKRKTDEDNKYDTHYATYRAHGHSYTIKGDLMGAKGERLQITERFVDHQFIEISRLEIVRDNYRDKRELIRTADF